MANANTKNVLVKYELEDKQEKNVVVPRSAAEIQRFKLEKLLKKVVSNCVCDARVRDWTVAPGVTKHRTGRTGRTGPQNRYILSIETRLLALSNFSPRRVFVAQLTPEIQALAA